MSTRTFRIRAKAQTRITRAIVFKVNPSTTHVHVGEELLERQLTIVGRECVNKSVHRCLSSTTDVSLSSPYTILITNYFIEELIKEHLVLFSTSVNTIGDSVIAQCLSHIRCLRVGTGMSKLVHTTTQVHEVFRVDSIVTTKLVTTMNHMT